MPAAEKKTTQQKPSKTSRRKGRRGTGKANSHIEIAGRIRAAILSGVWPPGTKLPSYRVMAKVLGISKNTIAAAVVEAERLGYLRVEPRRGAFVQAPENRPAGPEWLELMGGAAYIIPPVAEHSRQSRLRLADDAVNLSHRMDETWDGFAGPRFVAPYIKRAFERLEAGRLPNLYHEQGLLPLREQLAGWLGTTWGIEADADTILILSRRMQAYNVVSETFLSPEIVAAYQDVCFLNFYSVGISRMARRLPLPSDGHGIVIDPLRKVRGRPFLFVQPTHCEPTGLMTDRTRRREIIDWCTYARVPVMEDAVMDPFYLGENQPPPLKAMDTAGNVIYLGGVHGPVTPSMSLNWIAAPKPVIERLLSTVKREGQFPSEVNQMVVHEVLADGAFGAFLSSERDLLREKYAACEAILRQWLSDVAEWSTDNAWGRIWLVFREGIRVSRLYRMRRDVDFYPGEIFGDRSDRAVLLYIFCDLATFELGIRRLRSLVEDCFGV